MASKATMLTATMLHDVSYYGFIMDLKGGPSGPIGVLLDELVAYYPLDTDHNHRSGGSCVHDKGALKGAFIRGAGRQSTLVSVSVACAASRSTSSGPTTSSSTACGTNPPPPTLSPSPPLALLGGHEREVIDRDHWEVRAPELDDAQVLGVCVVRVRVRVGARVLSHRSQRGVRGLSQWNRRL